MDERELARQVIDEQTKDDPTPDKKQAEAARLLKERISGYSQERYSAGWMEDVEFYVWDVLAHGYGNVFLKPEDKTELRELAVACGGWVDAEGWVPMSRWLERYNAWRDTRG